MITVSLHAEETYEDGIIRLTKPVPYSNFLIVAGS